MDEEQIERLKAQPLFKRLIDSQKEIADVLKEKDLLEAWKHLESIYNKMLRADLERLIPLAAKAMGVRQSTLESHVPNVSIVLIPEINAGYNPKREPLVRIRVYWGLMKFFHVMLVVFCSRVGFGVLKNGKDPSIVEDPTIPFEDSCILARQLMADYYNGAFTNPMAGTLTTQLSNAQLVMSSILLNYAEAFVVAHELGHVAVNLSPQNTTIELGNIVAEQLQSQIAAGTNIHIPPDSKFYWAEEFAADHFALTLLPQLTTEPFVRILAITSAEAVLIMFDMLERYKVNVLRLPVSMKYHPPSLSRLSFVRLVLEHSNDSNMFQLGRALEQQADGIMKNVCGY